MPDQSDAKPKIRPVPPEFRSHQLNEVGLRKSAEITSAFTELMHRLEDVCPSSQHFLSCRRKLEEASFYARKSMATSPENRKAE